MNKEELWKRLNEVFRDVFDDKKINVNENTTSEDIEDWDSLEPVSYTHLTLPTILLV